MRLQSTLNRLGGALRHSYWPPVVMATDGTLQIRLNGEHRAVPGGVSIAEMLKEIGVDPAKVAVERNLEIVPRSAFGDVRVEDGDEYEIVHFVGGG
jgi:thiazole synthase